MCSIEQRVQEIGQAIEELAVQAGMPAEGAAAIEPDDSSRILARLAELWGLLADLDPEVARRLAGYQALLWPVRPHRQRRCPTAAARPARGRGVARGDSTAASLVSFQQHLRGSGAAGRAGPLHR